MIVSAPDVERLSSAPIVTPLPAHVLVAPVAVPVNVIAPPLVL